MLLVERAFFSVRNKADIKNSHIIIIIAKELLVAAAAGICRSRGDRFTLWFRRAKAVLSFELLFGFWGLAACFIWTPKQFVCIFFFYK